LETSNKEKLIGKSLVKDRKCKIKSKSQNLVFFDFPKTQNNKDEKFKAHKLFLKLF